MSSSESVEASKPVKTVSSRTPSSAKNCPFPGARSAVKTGVSCGFSKHSRPNHTFRYFFGSESFSYSREIGTGFCRPQRHIKAQTLESMPDYACYTGGLPGRDGKGVGF